MKWFFKLKSPTRPTLKIHIYKGLERVCTGWIWSRWSNAVGLGYCNAFLMLFTPCPQLSFTSRVKHFTAFFLNVSILLLGAVSIMDSQYDNKTRMRSRHKPELVIALVSHWKELWRLFFLGLMSQSLSRMKESRWLQRGIEYSWEQKENRESVTGGFLLWVTIRTFNKEHFFWIKVSNYALIARSCDTVCAGKDSTTNAPSFCFKSVKLS